MMNWNNNDTKYIIKKILLYLIITGIVFCFGTKCAKALTQSEFLYNPSLNMNIAIANGTKTKSYRITNAAGQNYTAFQNYGEGYVVFTFQTTQSNTATSQLKAVEIGNSTDYYTCELGTTIVYNDSSAQKTIYTAKCHVNFNNNKGATNIVFYRASDTGDLNIWISELGTFVSESNGADSIINANNNAVQSQINAIANESANLQNTITQSTQSTVNAINNSTSAISDNTQAINDLKDTINADYSYDSDLDDMFTITGLFQEDDDFIRGLIMFPFTIFAYILGLLESNSCHTYTLGTLYGVTLTLPCIDVQTLIGSVLYGIIDSIFAMVVMFGIIRYLIGLYDYVFTVGVKGVSTAMVTTEVFK